MLNVSYTFQIFTSAFNNIQYMASLTKLFAKSIFLKNNSNSEEQSIVVNQSFNWNFEKLRHQLFATLV